jgi:phage terminase large subunit GpA-like protein
MAKSELYGWLRLDPPTEESGEAFPPGYCHHPEYGADYFKQLTAEQLQIHRKKTGFVTLEWEIIPGRENHYLDARVYARAAAALVGMDRFSDADWARLMGTPEPAPSKSEAVPAKDDDPAAAAQQRTRRQQMRESFLGDRSRGYWNRRR